MLLTCPGCSKSFDSREPLRVGETEVSCPYCRALATVVVSVKISKAPSPPAQPVLSPERTVLVAVEGAATKEMIQEVLAAGGYEAVMISTGKEALAALERAHPSVALLDVGLPEIMGFELCEKIKKSDRFRNVKVILVASIYDKKRYKREPDSLYGADDYVERHDIQDRLLSKIDVLLGKHPAVSKEAASVSGPVSPAPKPASPASKPSPPTAHDMDSMFLEEETVYEPSLHPMKPAPAQRPPAAPPPMETVRSPLEEATVYEPSLHPMKPAPAQRPPAAPPPVEAAKNPPVAGDPKHEAAKRLARLILSDIGLYNPRAVEQGIRNNTFRQSLKNELEEGRKLYCSRVSSDIAPDYYDQAIEDFIKKRKGAG